MAHNVPAVYDGLGR